jgi:hypothetical protein
MHSSSMTSYKSCFYTLFRKSCRNPRTPLKNRSPNSTQAYHFPSFIFPRSYRYYPHFCSSANSFIYAANFSTAGTGTAL